MPGQVSESNGNGSLSLVQAFANPGVFAIEAIVTWDRGRNRWPLESITHNAAWFSGRS